MAAITIQTTFTLEDASGRRVPHAYGRTVTGLTETAKRQFVIAALSQEIIWNPSVDTSEQFESFAFVALIADGTCDVELTCNEGDANEELFSIRLVKGVPLTLPDDTSYYNHATSDAFGGSADVIDKIRVDVPGSTAVTLDMIIVK